MAKKLTINNVIYVNKFIDKAFVWGHDWSVRADYLEVVSFENDEFKREIYCIDDTWGDELIHYEVTINYASNKEELYAKYIQYLKKKRINESKLDGHSLRAEVGDTIEVYKGRKYPIGTRFIVKDECVWKDRYGREQAFYWITTTGVKVDKFNCVIVG